MQIFSRKQNLSKSNFKVLWLFLHVLIPFLIMIITSSGQLKQDLFSIFCCNNLWRKYRTWNKFFILLYWKVSASMESVYFQWKLLCPNQIFSARHLQIFVVTVFVGSDQTKLAYLPSEIKLQNSVSMCKKILWKNPRFCLGFVTI